MSEDRLRNLLREEPLPGAAEAEQRGLALVSQAYAERRPPSRPVLPRLAVALAAAALLAALLLTPAGAAVRDWIDDVFTAGVRHAEPALTEVPGGGELLVQSPRGPWVVQADGSRRLLGRYGEATWSPRGLFVAASSGRTLSAIEPDGTPRWSISAGGTVRTPRWSPSGFRIAYRAGRGLRVAHADASEDRLIDDRVAPVAPAWFPAGPHLLAYVDADGEVRVRNTDSGEVLTSVGATSPHPTALGWDRDGSELLQASSRGIWLRHVGISKLVERIELGPARRLNLPAGAIVRTTSFAPDEDAIAVLLRRRTRAGVRDEVLVLDPHGGPPRRLLSISGRLEGLAWSPGGDRLLVGWPAANQWLFLPFGAGRIEAVNEIASTFSPGSQEIPPFPHIEGWCCPPAPGGFGWRSRSS